MLFAFNKSSSVMTLHSISNQFSCTFAVVTKLQMNEFGLDNFVKNLSQIKSSVTWPVKIKSIIGLLDSIKTG